MKPTLWFLFLAWAAVGLLTLALGLDPAWLRGQNLPGPLHTFIAACLHWGDFLFIALAFGNVFLVALGTWGRKSTARAAGIILIGSAILETLGALTGQPFGFYTYTDNFGPRLGHVLPLAIPLAWFLVIMGFRLALDGLSATHAWPAWSRALAVGALATAFDWILEPFAWKVRAYWLWLDGFIPLQNYAAWFAFATLFAAFALPKQPTAPKTRKPAWVLGVMVVFFLCGRLAN